MKISRIKALILSGVILVSSIAPVQAASAAGVRTGSTVCDSEWERLNDPLYEKYHNQKYEDNDKLARSKAAITPIEWGVDLYHNERFDNCDQMYGIDVSKWQGNIDWKKVQKAGVQFAIIRLGNTGMQDGVKNLDPYFTKNIQNAHDAGIKVGVYYFSEAINEGEARAEAAFCAENLKPYEGYLDFPVMYDIENTKDDRIAKAKLDKATLTKNCLAFCEEIEAYGYKAAVYSYKNYFNSKLNMTEISPRYYVWLAEYTCEATYKGNYQMWQYSDGNSNNQNIVTEKVAGISGNVDLDVAYINREAFTWTEDLSGCRISIPQEDGTSLEYDCTVELVSEKIANCLTGSTRTYKATYGNSFEYKTVVTGPSSGHVVVTDPAVPATCTADGLTEGSHCSACNTVLVEQQVVAATDHEWDDGEVSVKATVFKEGERIYTCYKCGETKSEVIEKLTPKATLSSKKKTLKLWKSFTLKISKLANGDSIKKVKVGKKSILALKKTSTNKYKVTAKKRGITKVYVTLASGVKYACKVTVK